MLATGNQLLPFGIIDLAGGSGYLRDISPHLRIPLARKILLADDSVTAQNMGRKILADAGYEVTTVNNGSAALKRVAEQRPDLIVLDVYMPGYSGLEVCQRLKEAGDTSRIPILLTVGKLEPFKPEEAKRVRADGFIVKPFEASELLSALSKLEDKIVPRAESSKPGRLARATAAIDDVPRDKTVSGEEDSGWKNRISFPSKKKEKAAEAEADESSTYNPVNKDLRTVIEPRPAVEAKHSVTRAEEAKVDLGALAPEGLPKDVTAEEIAALAAAAAQMQGTIQEGKADQSGLQSAPVTAAVAAPAPAELAPEAKFEALAPAAQETPKESVPVPENAPAVEAVSELKQEPDKEQEADSNKELKKESWSHDAAEPADVPVTMAVATGSDSHKSHWTAVAVALAPEDTGISLAQEMQNASAAYASEQPVAVEASPVAEASPSAAVAPIEAAASVPDAPAEEPSVVTAASEATQTLSEIAAVATDTVRAAVKEFETVAAAYVPENESSQTYSSSPAVEASSPEPAPAIEKEAEPTPIAAEETNRIEAEAQQPASEYLKTEETEAKSEILAPEGPAPAPEVPVEQAVASQDSAPAASSSQDSISHESVSQESVASAVNSAPGPQHERGHLSTTTEAAWASWRRIRESDTPADSSESAAMAVAAGAEKSPEDAASGFGSDTAIASIVDSVLADLRPKIVEEISRKLGKKT
jgi:CheY-like chemotaxis protein